MRNKKEAQIHSAICDYLRLQYPSVIFTSEAGGIYTNITQARLIKRTRSSVGIPDLMIFEPKAEYCGLFLEIKADGTNIYKKNGEFVKNEHLNNQREVIQKLINKGYACFFVIGFDNAKQIIDHYMSL
jgi:hypothetical protein